MVVTRSAVLPPNAAEFIVNEWIGVEHGQLLEFTHPELTEFFRRYTELADSHPGVLRNAGPLEGYGPTKRERFILALDSATPKQQLSVLKGLLQRLPVDPGKGRTRSGESKINNWIGELELSLSLGDVEIDGSDLAIPDVARLALEAAIAHQEQGDHHLAMDRVHTALHACVKRLAEECGVDVAKNEKLRDQFGAVRRVHPAFRVEKGDRATADVLQGLAKTIDGLNSARNKNTLVHPNDALLADPEARLFCNAGTTLLQYLMNRTEAPVREQEQEWWNPPASSQNDDWAAEDVSLSPDLPSWDGSDPALDVDEFDWDSDLPLE